MVRSRSTRTFDDTSVRNKLAANEFCRYLIWYQNRTRKKVRAGSTSQRPRADRYGSLKCAPVETVMDAPRLPHLAQVNREPITLSFSLSHKRKIAPPAFRLAGQVVDAGRIFGRGLEDVLG